MTDQTYPHDMAVEATLCAMIVTNPSGRTRPQNWQKRVNELISAQAKLIADLRREVSYHQRREEMMNANDDTPVCVSVELDEVIAAMGVLKECSQDLESYLEAQYLEPRSEANERRFQRDMTPVIAARGLLQRWEKWKVMVI